MRYFVVNHETAERLFKSDDLAVDLSSPPNGPPGVLVEIDTGPGLTTSSNFWPLIDLVQRVVEVDHGEPLHWLELIRLRTGLAECVEMVDQAITAIARSTR